MLVRSTRGSHDGLRASTRDGLLRRLSLLLLSRSAGLEDLVLPAISNRSLMLVQVHHSVVRLAEGERHRSV